MKIVLCLSLFAICSCQTLSKKSRYLNISADYTIKMCHASELRWHYPDGSLQREFWRKEEERYRDSESVYMNKYQEERLQELEKELRNK